MHVQGVENFIPQFPDLTEICCMSESWNVAHVLPKNLEEIKTEFIFFVKAQSTSENAIELGFKPVSAMNNWYPAHRAERRRMLLYWLRNPNSDGKPQKCFRINWAHNRCTDPFKDDPPYVVDRLHMNNDTFLAASGCGFSIGEPPFVKEHMHQFHTLMRMPVEVPRLQAKELVKHGYRLLDTGKLASYWINGWKPEEYDYAKECEYFKVNLDWSPIKRRK